MVWMEARTHVSRATLGGEKVVASIQVTHVRNEPVLVLAEHTGQQVFGQAIQERTSPARDISKSPCPATSTPTYSNIRTGHLIARACNFSNRSFLTPKPTTVIRLGYCPVRSLNRATENKRF
jgi:hypothetical protein